MVRNGGNDLYVYGVEMLASGFFLPPAPIILPKLKKRCIGNPLAIGQSYHML